MGAHWRSFEFLGPPRNSSGVLGLPQHCLEFLRIIWIPQKSLEFLGIPMNSFEFRGIPFELFGTPLNSLEF